MKKTYIKPSLVIRIVRPTLSLMTSMSRSGLPPESGAYKEDSKSKFRVEGAMSFDEEGNSGFMSLW